MCIHPRNKQSYASKIIRERAEEPQNHRDAKKLKVLAECPRKVKNLQTQNVQRTREYEELERKKQRITNAMNGIYRTCKL